MLQCHRFRVRAHTPMQPRAYATGAAMGTISPAILMPSPLSVIDVWRFQMGEAPRRPPRNAHPHLMLAYKQSALVQTATVALLARANRTHVGARAPPHALVARACCLARVIALGHRTVRLRQCRSPRRHARILLGVRAGCARTHGVAATS